MSSAVNSIGSSSTNGEKTAMKKCFQNTPQILNFDEPPLHANPSDNLEEAGMCIFCSDNVVSACNRDEIITISIIAEYARIRGIVDESPDLYEHDGRLA